MLRLRYYMRLTAAARIATRCLMLMPRYVYAIRDVACLAHTAFMSFDDSARAATRQPQRYARYMVRAEMISFVSDITAALLRAAMLTMPSSFTELRDTDTPPLL